MLLAMVVIETKSSFTSTDNPKHEKTNLWLVKISSLKSDVDVKIGSRCYC